MRRGRDHGFDHVPGLGHTGRDRGSLKRGDGDADAHGIDVRILWRPLVGIPRGGLLLSGVWHSRERYGEGDISPLPYPGYYEPI